MSVSNLIRNFKMFCSMCDGKYEEEIFPSCKRFSFRISLEYLEKENTLSYLKLKIVSGEGDEEEINLYNVRILGVERKSEEENGVIRFYSLIIHTDKGILSLKKDIREDKLYVEFSGRDLKYRSSIIF